MQLILVGDDGSSAAAHAVEWAARLTDERGATLVVLHVTAVGDTTPQEHGLPRVVVQDTHPASAIMKTADDRNADLIVLGRRGSGGFPSLPIGTTAHHVAAASGRPVAVVPSVTPTTTRPLVQRAVIGLDGLPGSAEAAAWSVQQWPDAHFTAVHAVELAPALAQLDDGAGTELYDRAHARAAELLRERWAAPLVDAGAVFDTAVQDGGPAEVILDVAARLPADVVVVGRREHYPLRGTLGGVSQRVLAYAPCPAVIVPSPS